jgi:hypothetical protein
LTKAVQELPSGFHAQIADDRANCCSPTGHTLNHGSPVLQTAAGVQGDEHMDLSSIRDDDITAIAPLSSSQKFTDTLKRVQEEMEQHGDEMPDSWAGPSEADPLYRLIVTCNELAMAVDDEIAKVHAYTQEKCGLLPGMHCHTAQAP